MTLGAFGALAGRRWPAVILATTAWLVLAWAVLGVDKWGASDFLVAAVPARFFLLFLVGVVFQQFADRIAMSWVIALASASLLVVSENILEADYRIVGAVPLVYLVLWLASRLPIRVGSRVDLSYGLYLFGWPMQQFLVIAGVAAAGWWVFTAASVAAALPLAAACWFLVEKPSMRLREWKPGGLLPQRGGPPAWVSGLLVMALFLAYFSLWLVHIATQDASAS